MNIQCSTELLRDQKHAVVMAPDSQFEVLQSPEGYALFFSIGTDNVFYITRELPATTPEGWTKIDLSAPLSKQYPGTTVKAKKFQLSDNIHTGAIDLALVVTVNNADFLYVSLNNTNSADTWQQPLVWTLMTFDDVASPLKTICISDIYAAQKGSSNLLVADILKDPADPLKVLTRYFIDPSKKITGSFWNIHELAIDLSAGTTSNCIGRKADELVDGIYTLGTIGNTTELVYTPLFDPFDIPGPPSPTRITLPAGTTAMALSVKEKGFTDLFLAAGGSLYFLDNTAQQDGQQPALLYSHPLLNGVESLHVNNNAEQVIVWGLNNEGQIFYLKCRPGRETIAGSWTTPIPIVSNAIKAATYLHCRLCCHVIFAHMGDDTLVHLTQDPVTTAWSQRNIVLPATDPDDIIEIATYTTLLQLIGDNNLPVTEEDVAISSASQCNVYIDNVYYVLNPGEPVTIEIDSTGTLSIIQEVKGLHAACYNIEAGGQTVNVNPMNEVIASLEGKSLDDVVTDEWDNSRPLTSADIPASQKKAIMQGVGQFIKIAGSLPKDGSVINNGAKAYSPGADDNWNFNFRMDFKNNDIQYIEGDSLSLRAGNVIETAAGDAWKWAMNEMRSVEGFAVKFENGLFNFYLYMKDSVFHHIISCFRDALQAIQLLLQKMKVLVNDVIDWLGNVLHWKAIVRTKDVIKNVIKQYIHNCIDEIGNVEKDIKDVFDHLQGNIDNWANIPAINESYDQLSSSIKPIPGQNSPKSNWGVRHFKNGVRKATTSYAPPDPVVSDDIKTILDDIRKCIDDEKTVITDAVRKMEAIILQTGSSTTDIIKQVTAVLTDAVLGTAENVVLLLLKILQNLLADATKALESTINIPVISWMYKKVSGKPLSALDLSCLVLAIPVYVMYKEHKKADIFPKDNFTQSLIDAPDWKTITNIFAATASGTNMLQAGGDTLYDKLVFAGNGLACIGAVLINFTTLAKVKEPESKFLAFATGLLYFPYTAPDIIGTIPAIKENRWFLRMNTLVTAFAILKAMVDVSSFKKNNFTAAWADLSPGIDCLTGIVWEVPAIGAICYKENQNLDGIFNLFGNTFFNFTGLLAPDLAYDKDPETWTAFAIEYTFCNGAYGILSLAQSID